MDISDKNQKPELIHSKAKRDQFAYEIRKSKNDEFVRAKRMKYFDNIRGEPDQNNEEIMAEAEGVKKSYDELTSNFYSAIEKGDPDLITTTVTHIRHKISAKSTPNLKEFYATGLLNSILKILDEKFSNYILLQKEALWVAINAFSGEFELYKEIVDENLINLIYSFIWHKEPFMVEEVMRQNLINLLGFPLSWKFVR